MSRLSSDYLFHFKTDVRIVCQILQHGFRHNLWSESLPYRNTQQQNFVCCFCDILPSQAYYHASVYGRNALALTKDWGIRKNISPVRYVHEGSVGTSATYSSARLLWRSATTLGEDVHEQMLQNYIISARLCAEGLVPSGNVKAAMENDPSVANRYRAIDKEIRIILNSIPNKTMKAVLEIFNDVFNQVIVLNNEVESRNAFMRAYREDFRNSDGHVIPGKVLYDEREWRSIKMIAAEEDHSHSAVYAAALGNKFLPPAYNLTFSGSDLKYIVVETDADKVAVTDFVTRNHCLVSADELSGKLVRFDELRD